MSKTARLYQDTRTATAAESNLDKLNGELNDVTRIMTKNMEELLWRGDSLDSKYSSLILLLLFDEGTWDFLEMSHLSTSLRSESEKYRKAARQINVNALLRQWAPVGGVGLLFLIIVWWKFF